MSLAAIWTATFAGALLQTAGVVIHEGTRPRDALNEAPGTALALLAHNAPIAVWPLALIAIGWPELPGARALGDLLVIGQLIGHGVVVGCHIAQYPELWRYLPHLPMEWLGLAMPAAAWLDSRRSAAPRDGRRLALLAGACLAALVIAGVIETYCVPVA